MSNKAVIFDSGVLISFSMNGILDILETLKKNFNGKFLITEFVKREVIDKPLTIKKFELEALKIKRMLDSKILEMPESLGINKQRLNSETDFFMGKANNLFKENGSAIRLVSKGEMSCLALSKILSEKGIRNLVAIDERTARMICENPEALKGYLEKRFHSKLYLNKSNAGYFKKFKIIRSAELLYVAFKKGYTNLENNKKVLDSLLYAVKFKGCAISGREIKEIEDFATGQKLFK